MVSACHNQAASIQPQKDLPFRERDVEEVVEQAIEEEPVEEWLAFGEQAAEEGLF